MSHEAFLTSTLSFSWQPIIQEIADAGAMQRLANELERIESEESSAIWRTTQLPIHPVRYDGPSSVSGQVGSSSGQQANGGGSEVDWLFQHLKKGAADLKAHLISSRARGLPLVVAWLDSQEATGSSSANLAGNYGPTLISELKCIARDARLLSTASTSLASSGNGSSGSSSPSALVLAAFIRESAANRALAAALKVESPPVFHMYQDMQVCVR